MTLVIAAHPDDELLGCGATLCKWKDSGFPPHIAFAGTGREGGTQAEDAERVAAKAGWKLEPFGPFRDNAFGPIAEVAAWVEDLVKRRGSRRILIHSADELNQDHQILRHACLIACRPFASTWHLNLGQSRELWSFEVPGSTGYEFHPNIFVEMPGHFKRKVQLLAMYAREAQLAPHPRSPFMLEARARHWGSFAGVQMAEAFRLEFQLIGQTSGTAS